MALSKAVEIEILSASTDGKPVAVAATSSPGTTIHTASSDTAERDYITLWAVNVDTVARSLTVQWGGTTTAEQIGPIEIPPSSGLVAIAEALPIQNALLVRAFADSANKINIVGKVSRATL